ncbi:hypothetical protein HNO88_001634 [Novosphingobium chloroacetimidivorans]|uniref:DUF3142 domain-containing protein n=1 Tax=Novosphingobium chloroacetimidivorans TaxID=1428314 RepID=A0A7W7K986_9SPHN|nr:DUF3142 domain-containing protein [Novosphingobium chloroacetimidivorans]MBB4858315.1 hypothetical protein [Novosphingobium chloroacetimidivorans]
MGDRPQVLLVSRRALLCGSAASLLVAGCETRKASQTVDPRAYQAFFLWPGVPAPPWLKQAREVYLLAGEVRHQAGSRFEPLRATPRVPGPALWLVVRVERLDWSEAIHRDVQHALALWRAAGNRVAGLQIDFDAATRGLAGYARFLADLRRRLPPGIQLSITGLMDWSAGGDPRALRQLGGIVDEIVVQTYQGRRTIPGYEAYLRGLAKLGMPYRIGLVEDGSWNPPAHLAQDPNMRGYVVFLLGNGS